MSKSAFHHLLVSYRSGESLFDEGDLGATMFIVQSGRVELFSNMDGEEQSLGVMEKGDFFGEMSILEGLPRTNSAKALEDADLIEINSMTFDKMIKGNIEIAVRLLRKLSLRLREAERRNAELQLTGAKANAKPRSVSAARAKPSQPAADGVRLEALEESIVFAVVEPETLIGRYDPVTELRPDVDLTEVDLKRSVSRRHARVVLTAEGYSLTEEVGALNGTFVNNAKLVTGQPHPLCEGDEVGIGMVKLRFRT